MFYLSLNPTVAVMSKEWGTFRSRTASSQESKQNDPFAMAKGNFLEKFFQVAVNFSPPLFSSLSKQPKNSKVHWKCRCQSQWQQHAEAQKS